MEVKNTGFSLSLLLFFCCFFVEAFVAVNGRAIVSRKPDPADAAATARWLASQNSWGVLSTISQDLGGSPFGNVVSFSDGLPGHGRGIPYFYLTPLDPTARNALKDERSSFSISEHPLGTCGKTDPENPTCSKITLNGKLKLIDGKSKEAEYAQRALFTKHPEMKDWPKDHNFQIFKLVIENIFLIDWFGGAKPLTVAEYLHYGMEAINWSFSSFNIEWFKDAEGAQRFESKFINCTIIFERIVVQTDLATTSGFKTYVRGKTLSVDANRIATSLDLRRPAPKSYPFPDSDNIVIQAKFGYATDK